MAFVKKHSSADVEEYVIYETLQEAKEAFLREDDDSKKDFLVDNIIGFNGGAEFLVEYISEHETQRMLTTKIASSISSMEPDEAPIEAIMDLLKLNNAFIRNLGISMLRDFGPSIKYYIVKFLIGEDRDLRIFAINVLGDVSFSESREMMVELLTSEDDINVAMTAVDYMGEIGEEEDIPLLESLKARFDGEVYVEFAVDGAVKMIKG